MPAHVTPAERERRDATIREMHARGQSDYSIAVEIGVDRSTVQVTRKRLGLPPVPQYRVITTGNHAGKHKKPSDIRISASSAASFTQAWQPRQRAASGPSRATYYDLRYAQPSGKWGCRAYDGLWWDGNIRASGAPYTSPFADCALPFPTQAEARRVLEEAGFGDVLRVEEIGL